MDPLMMFMQQVGQQANQSAQQFVARREAGQDVGQAIVGSLPGMLPVIGNIFGMGADGPDPTLQAIRGDNRQRAGLFLDHLADAPRFSGMHRHDILEQVMRDAGLVGRVEVGTTGGGKPRTANFREGDLDSLGRVGSRGTLSKRSRDAFDKFTGRDVVVSALADAAGFQTAGNQFGFEPKTEAFVPNVNTSSPVPGDVDFMGPVQDYYGSGPGFDMGDIFGSNSFLANVFGDVGQWIGGGGLGNMIPDVIDAFSGGRRERGNPRMQIPTGWLPGGAPSGGFVLPNVNTSGGNFSIAPRTTTRTRMPSTVAGVVQTPTGGSKIVQYKNQGRPLLWSGDLAAARRVKKIAAKARKARGGR